MRNANRVVVLLVLTSLSALAQTTGAGTLVGTVSDTTGALIAGAKVTVINNETAFVSNAQTTNEGAYRVPYLAPGLYRITIESAGFKKSVMDGVQVRSGETPRLDVKLELGSVSESVEVTGSAPLLATEDASAGGLLAGGELVKIPVPQKVAQRMLFYFPNASSMSGYHVLGQRQNMIGYTVDGVNGKEPGIQNFGGTDTQISSTQDAFEEVKVYTTGTPAEFGHSAGGQMSIVFKSGANKMHGMFEDRYIGKSMVHRSYLEQLQPTTPLSYHELTGMASGPVVLPKLYTGRDKTFWLVGWAYHREIGGTSSARTAVPTAEMLNGDFSFGGQTTPKVLPIYNPFTTRQVNGTWTRDVFAGNLIPKSLFDPVAAAFLGQTPFTKANQAGIPGATGPTENLVADQRKEINRMRWDAKIDHQFTPNHKAFARYSQGRHRAWKGDYQAQFAWRDLDPNAQPQPVDQLNGVLSDIAILSPTTNNEFRIGYNRRALVQDSLFAGQNWTQKLGIPNADGGSFPYFNIGYGLTGLSQFKQIGEDITVQDNFTKVWSKHTIKSGYELMRTRYNASSASLPGGSYTFGGTDLPFTPNTGNTFASFLLGTVSSATFTQSFGSWLPRWWSHQFYVQDDWKPLPKLSLNLGVRYSYETPFQTKYGQASQFDPTATDPVTGKTGAIIHPTEPLAKGDRNNFAPRIGLSYNFRPNWVFRSSFGVIHQDIFAVTQNIMFDEYLGTATVSAAVGDPRTVFRLSEGPPAFQYKIRQDGSVPFIGTNYSTRTASRWDPNMRMPYVMNYAAGVQWQFRPQWMVEANYQGQAGVGLVNAWDMNAIRLDIASDTATLNQIFQATQNYKPYTQFGSINYYSNFGHNTHHSGTLRLEKRRSNGISLNAFYTWSKTLTETDGEGTATGITYYNRGLEKGRTAFDIAHRFVGIVMWELPFGRGRRWMSGRLLDTAFGGWELAAIQTLQSGTPFTVTFSGSPNRYLPGVSRPNIVTDNASAYTANWAVGTNRFPTSAQTPYLIAGSFAYPAAFTPGTLGRNTFEGPGLNCTQLSLSKTWRVAERYRFQLRFDGNNFPFKQPNFSNPAAVFNANSPGSFARMTGVQGSYSNMGFGRPSYYVIGKFEF